MLGQDGKQGRSCIWDQRDLKVVWADSRSFGKLYVYSDGRINFSRVPLAHHVVDCQISYGNKVRRLGCCCTEGHACFTSRPVIEGRCSSGDQDRAAVGCSAAVVACRA